MEENVQTKESKKGIRKEKDGWKEGHEGKDKGSQSRKEWWDEKIDKKR